MSKITITEALSELNLIDKRVAKKREFVTKYLVRQEAMKDPLVSQGGSERAIQQERQAIGDLQDRKIMIRRAINDVNATTELTIEKEKRTIAEWLIWRREVLPNYRNFLNSLSGGIAGVRRDAMQKGWNVVTGEGKLETDVVVHIDELELANEMEQLEVIEERLDGQLSLLNARTEIEV